MKNTIYFPTLRQLFVIVYISIFSNPQRDLKTFIFISPAPPQIPD